MVKLLRRPLVSPDELHAHAIPVQMAKFDLFGDRTQCAIIVIFYAISASGFSLWPR
jgi:hypothetical protein